MKLIVTTFLTLDGVMQSPGAPEEDPCGGFTHGGWLVPYFSADMGPIVAEQMAQADSFLLGRKTYEIFAGYWPRATDPADPVATALNQLPKYVVSNTLSKVDWNNSKLIKSDLSEEITKLKRQAGRELQVHGSSGLAQTLIQKDLVDEYRLWFFPVVVGSGKRLFGPTTPALSFKLIDSKMMSSGVVMNRYARAGEIRHGAVPQPEQSTSLASDRPSP